MVGVMLGWAAGRLCALPLAVLRAMFVRLHPSHAGRADVCTCGAPHHEPQSQTDRDPLGRGVWGLAGGGIKGARQSAWSVR